MWERARGQIFKHPLAAFWFINGRENLGKRFHGARTAQCQGLAPAQQGLDRATKLSPKFNLASDRSLGGVGCKPGVEQKLVRNLNGLCHNLMVAFCYRIGNLDQHEFFGGQPVRPTSQPGLYDA